VGRRPSSEGDARIIAARSLPGFSECSSSETCSGESPRCDAVFDAFASGAGLAVAEPDDIDPDRAKKTKSFVLACALVTTQSSSSDSPSRTELVVSLPRSRRRGGRRNDARQEDAWRPFTPPAASSTYIYATQQLLGHTDHSTTIFVQGSAGRP
jgi:hypothetical protein